MRLLLALACVLMLGCGRFDFGVLGDADTSIGPREITPPAFSTTSTTFVPVPGATLTVPPSVGTQWLVVVSATLTSTTIVDINVEARYLVDGVERGLGGTQANLGAGPWQHFHVLDGTAAAQTIAFELRDASGGTATIDQLHAVLVPLPANADAHYVSADAPQQFLDQTVVSMPYSLGPLAGEYVVFVLANTTDLPARKDAFLAWSGPAGEVLVPDSQNAREAWQSMFMVGVLGITSGDAVFTLAAHGGTPTAIGQVEYMRVLALRRDAFASVDELGTVTPIDTASPNLSIGPALAPAGSASSYVYIASSLTRENCGASLALRRLHFVIDDADRMIEHAADNCAMHMTYGAVGLLGSRPTLVQNGVSSGNGEHVIMDSSEIVLLGLP